MRDNKSVEELVFGVCFFGLLITIGASCIMMVWSWVEWVSIEGGYDLLIQALPTIIFVFSLLSFAMVCDSEGL